MATVTALPPRSAAAPASARPANASGPSGGDADAVGAYLRALRHSRLLTADEEVSLARAIEAGVLAQERLEHLRELGSSGLRFEADEVTFRRALRLLADAGASAKTRMIESNLRLVVHISRRFQGRGLPLGDLIQEGNLGLVRAVEKFDYTKGFKFSTYATWWIRQAVSRAVADTARVVRLPVHVDAVIARLERADAALSVALGRAPTSAELGRELELSCERVEQLLVLRQQATSLDQPVSEDGSATLGDLLADPMDAGLEAQVTSAALGTALSDALGRLSGRERQVLCLRYGIRDVLAGAGSAGDGAPMSLSAVAAACGVSRNAVATVERRALGKLRHGDGLELADFLT